MPESNDGSASALAADAKAVSAKRLVFIESIIFIFNISGVLDSFAFYGKRRWLLISFRVYFMRFGLDKRWIYFSPKINSPTFSFYHVLVFFSELSWFDH
ncbi:hypothetical protein D3C78_1428100 [compost metagenome]